MASNSKRIFAHVHKINGQGYDSSGIYFGSGATLYYIQQGDESGFVRAPNRDAAVAYVARYGIKNLGLYGAAECFRMFGHMYAGRVA